MYNKNKDTEIHKLNSSQQLISQQTMCFPCLKSQKNNIIEHKVATKYSNLTNPQKKKKDTFAIINKKQGPIKLCQL